MATATQPLNGNRSWWESLWPSRSKLELVPVRESVASPITNPTPADLLRIAVSQGADLDRLQKLMDLQERWEKNQARKAFVKAINSFKNSPPEIVKNATASFRTKPKNGGEGQLVTWDYASLDHICDAVIAALSDVGISHDWSFEQPDKELIRVTCVLTHDLGHERRTTLQGPPDYSGDKSPIHAVYSTVTHLERYTLLAAVGLAASEPEPDKTPQEISAGNRVRENCALMANAENLDQLQAIFRAAYAEASDQNDQKAQLAYIKAKDARRRELR